jgi:YesN/AraC family two-component response regulator
MNNVTFSGFVNFVYAHLFTIQKYEFTNRIYSYLEIVFITEGALDITINNEKYLLNKGDIMVIPKGSVVSVKTVEGYKKHSHYSVGVIGCFKETKCKEKTSFSFYIVQQTNFFDEIIDIFDKLILTNNFLEKNGLFFQLCSFIERGIYYDKRDGNFYVNKIKDYVKNNLNKQLSLDEISKNAGLTRQYTASIFKKNTKETIFTYINKEKIKKAKQLINLGGISLEYVANHIGIDNYSYFSKLFRKYEGVSPKKYKMTIQRSFIRY